MSLVKAIHFYDSEKYLVFFLVKLICYVRCYDAIIVQGAGLCVFPLFFNERGSVAFTTCLGIFIKMLAIADSLMPLVIVIAFIMIMIIIIILLNYIFVRKLKYFIGILMQICQYEEQIFAGLLHEDVNNYEVYTYIHSHHLLAL